MKYKDLRDVSIKCLDAWCLEGWWRNVKYKDLTKNEPLREVLTVNCVIVLVFLVGGSVSPEQLLSYYSTELVSYYLLPWLLPWLQLITMVTLTAMVSYNDNPDKTVPLTLGVFQCYC